MNRGRRGESIFESDKDRQLFLALLKESAELWDVRVSAYCLMANHYHILAQTPQGNLSRFMRHLNGVYTQRYNKLHGYDGPLFRGRFKSILVEEDNYLLELVRYIHCNPLRAAIVENLDEYPWSSHAGYLSQATKWDWLNKEIILTMMETNQGKQRKAYFDFLGQKDSQELLDLLAPKKWPSLLGSKKFTSWVKETFFEKKKHAQVPDSINLAPDILQIKSKVCLVYGVKEGDLLVAHRGINNEPRNVAIYLCRILRNDTLIELGREFGMSGYSAAGSVVERIKKKLIKDRGLQKKIAHIQDILFER